MSSNVAFDPLTNSLNSGQINQPEMNGRFTVESSNPDVREGIFRTVIAAIVGFVPFIFGTLGQIGLEVMELIDDCFINYGSGPTVMERVYLAAALGPKIACKLLNRVSALTLAKTQQCVWGQPLTQEPQNPNLFNELEWRGTGATFPRIFAGIRYNSCNTFRRIMSPFCNPRLQIPTGL